MKYYSDGKDAKNGVSCSTHGQLKIP
jgi:hypothetical protein